MPKGKGYKMPNEGSKSGGDGGQGKHTNTGSSTGLRMSNERRADVTKKPSSKNPYPNGLS